MTIGGNSKAIEGLSKKHRIADYLKRRHLPSATLPRQTLHWRRTSVPEATRVKPGYSFSLPGHVRDDERRVESTETRPDGLLLCARRHDGISDPIIRACRPPAGRLRSCCTATSWEAGAGQRRRCQDVGHSAGFPCRAMRWDGGPRFQNQRICARGSTYHSAERGPPGMRQLLF